jgi:hypothetical protein
MRLISLGLRELSGSALWSEWKDLACLSVAAKELGENRDSEIARAGVSGCNPIAEWKELRLLRQQDGGLSLSSSLRPPWKAPPWKESVGLSCAWKEFLGACILQGGLSSVLPQPTESGALTISTIGGVARLAGTVLLLLPRALAAATSSADMIGLGRLAPMIASSPDDAVFVVLVRESPRGRTKLLRCSRSRPDDVLRKSKCCVSSPPRLSALVDFSQNSPRTAFASRFGSISTPPGSAKPTTWSWQAAGACRACRCWPKSQLRSAAGEVGRLSSDTSCGFSALLAPTSLFGNSRCPGSARGGTGSR